MAYRLFGKLRRLSARARNEDWLQELRGHYQKALDNPSGQVVIQDLMNGCAYFDITDTDQNDAAVWFREGQRSLINYVLNQLELGDIQKLQEVADV